jgi:hypothetical protein
MSYVVKNLDELAALFEERAEEAKARIDSPAHKTSCEFAVLARENSIWQCAAYILRHTTITEDITCREI